MYIRVYKWVSIIDGACTKINEKKVASEEEYTPLREHAMYVVEEWEILTPSGIAYQYTLEDESGKMLDEFWTDRGDLIEG